MSFQVEIRGTTSRIEMSRSRAHSVVRLGLCRSQLAELVLQH